MLLLPQISQNTAAFVHTKLSLNQNQSSQLDWGAFLYFTDLHKSLETVIDHWTLLSRAKWAFKTTCKYFPPKFLQTKNKMATNWTTYLLDPGGAVRGVLALVTSGVRVGPGHADDDVTQPVTWASKQYYASSYSVVEECCHYCLSEQAISEHELSRVRYKEPVVRKGKTVEDTI